MTQANSTISNTTVPTINYLPIEVLRETLILCDKYRQSLVLVCHLWKEIIYCSPEFWTRVEITRDMDDRDIADILADIARSSNLPLQIVLDTRYMWMSVYKLQRVLDSIPFERWESLEVEEDLRWDVIIPKDANFKNLKYLGLNIKELGRWGANTNSWKILLSRIAATANDLHTLQADEYGLTVFASTEGGHLRHIIERVSTVKFEFLPHGGSPPMVLSSNISHLHINHISTRYWDLSHITHLEVHLFRLGAAFHKDRPSPETDPCFPNVEYLYIGKIRTDIRKGRIQFPKLRILRYNVQLLDPLTFFILPKLETIIFQKTVTDIPPPMGKHHVNPPTMDNWMQPTNIRFEGGILVHHLVNALAWFPKVQHLTAVITTSFPANAGQENNWNYMKQAFFERTEGKDIEAGPKNEEGALNEMTTSGFSLGRDLVRVQFVLSKEWEKNQDTFKRWDEFVQLMAKVRKGTALKTVSFI